MKKLFVLYIIMLLGSMSPVPVAHAAKPVPKAKATTPEMPNIIEEINDGVNVVEMPAKLEVFITTPPHPRSRLSLWSAKPRLSIPDRVIA